MKGRYYRPDPVTNTTAPLFFHRSVANFVIQTGGFIGTESASMPGSVQPTAVATFPAIQNEPVISNVRATIAMAKLGNDPNSATSQWFINLADNSANLDAQNGGFTVFGRVAGNGMAVADAIGAVTRYNFGSPFNELPLRNYNGVDAVRVPNLIAIPSITRTSPLVFSATSSNTSVATVSIGGTNLLVAGVQPGTAQITVTATDLDGVAVSQSFNVSVIAAPGRLRNISTRVNFPRGNEALIGGFIIRDGSSKRLAVRALGPSLANAGIANPLSNPTLELRDVSGALVASNDDWGQSPDKDLLMGLGLAPTAAAESALVASVPSGASISNYTAVVRSGAGTPGVGLVEVFDLDSNAGSSLLNLSTRGEVGTGNNVMIGGFITGGSDPRRLIVRALGPSLSQFNVPGVLPDPTLELRNAQGTLVDSNDNWQTHPGASEIHGLRRRAHRSARVGLDHDRAFGQLHCGRGRQWKPADRRRPGRDLPGAIKHPLARLSARSSRPARSERSCADPGSRRPRARHRCRVATSSFARCPASRCRRIGCESFPRSRRPTFRAASARMKAWTSCACSALAVLPVPMAQTGS